MDVLLELMRLRPLPDAARAGGADYRLLFQPTFTADACVTVHDYGDYGAVQMVIAPRSGQPAVVQYIWTHFWQTHYPALFLSTPLSALHREYVEIAADYLLDFRQAVGGLDFAALPTVAAGTGRDGMTVHGEIWIGAASHLFDVWSPSATDLPAPHRLCVAALDLAAENLPCIRSQQAIAAIRPYLAH
jgi:hypothetical protein